MIIVIKNHTWNFNGRLLGAQVAEYGSFLRGSWSYWWRVILRSWRISSSNFLNGNGATHSTYASQFYFSSRDFWSCNFLRTPLIILVAFVLLFYFKILWIIMTSFWKPVDIFKRLDFRWFPGMEYQWLVFIHSISFYSRFITLLKFTAHGTYINSWRS